MKGFWSNSILTSGCILCTIGNEADYQVVIVLMKNPYLYILTNMLLNLNGYYTRTVDCKTSTLSVSTHTHTHTHTHTQIHTTVCYIVGILLRERHYEIIESWNYCSAVVMVDYF